MKNNRNTNRTIIQLVVIMTILTIIAGSIALVNVSIKVISTAAGLAVLNDNIQFYNESTMKTTEMTAEAEEWFKIRDEKYYHSEDTLVRIYSNQNTFVKLIIAVLAFFVIFAIILMYGCYLLKIAKRIFREVERKRRIQHLRHNRRINGRGRIW